MSVFFSVIVPCYNSSRTIERLLDSLCDQGISKREYEVILCDDGSADSWYEKVEAYIGRLNIKYVDSDSDIHCPGNTRRAALKYAEGEWVCFADHDDMYEKYALARVQEFILSSGEDKCISTIMRSWNPKTDEYVPLIHKQAWLHGKFYNRRFLDENNISFKKDLRTHEDIYFNSCVLSALYSKQINDFSFFDIVTYRWIEEEDSITRSYKEKRGYLHENFDDYITAASYPFWEGAVKDRSKVHINQLMMTLLHSYFYYEAVSFLFGPKDYRDNADSIAELIQRIKKDLGVSSIDIINYIYADPIKYQLVRADCQLAEGMFIEKTSFKNFIEYLGKEERSNV